MAVNDRATIPTTGLPLSGVSSTPLGWTVQHRTSPRRSIVISRSRVAIQALARPRLYAGERHKVHLISIVGGGKRPGHHSNDWITQRSTAGIHGMDFATRTSPRGRAARREEECVRNMGGGKRPGHHPRRHSLDELCDTDLTTRTSCEAQGGMCRKHWWR